MNKRAINTLLRQIERRKVQLAQHRDKLRELEDEAAQLGSDAQEAVEHLVDAADALSRLV